MRSRLIGTMVMILSHITTGADSSVSVSVSTARTINTVDVGFKCWNIDASPNREWDTRDLSDPLLASLGRQSLPGHLRFGGAGNDGLPYALDMNMPSSPGNKCAAGAARCLNRTWVDNLAGFAKASNARLVFGLNVCACAAIQRPDPKGKSCHGKPWDPIETTVLLEYLIAANHTVWAFELGNEQNTNWSPALMAANFKVLSDLLEKLYPDVASRPKIIGPDVHGFHGDPRTVPQERLKLGYLKEFAVACRGLGVPLHAITHHEYVEVDQYPLAPPSSSVLNITWQIATAVNETLATYAPGVQIWAGEIGPHNGGTQSCDTSAKTPHRWANFADSHWYLDSMGIKAANGYSVFCRQDFVGIDYGMIDCATYAPLPDYYSAILWSELMGTSVLAVTSTSLSLRAYAHCSPGSGTPLGGTASGVTVLLLNLDNSTAQNVTLDGFDVTVPRMEWHLTGPGGAGSAEMALNGKLLVAKVVGGKYELPSLAGQRHEASDPSGPAVVEMAPASIAFVKLKAAGVCA